MINDSVKILGKTEDITTCDKCGKVNLKETVILEVDGDFVHYGTTCAAMIIVGNKKASTTKYINEVACFTQIVLETLKGVGIDQLRAALAVDRRIRYGVVVEKKDNGEYKVYSNLCGLVTEGFWK